MIYISITVIPIVCIKYSCRDAILHRFIEKMCTESVDTYSVMCFYIILHMIQEFDRHTTIIMSKETS